MSKKQILQLARFAVALFLIQRVSPLVLGQFAAIAVTWAEFPPDIKGGFGWSNISEWEAHNEPCYTCIHFQLPGKGEEDVAVQLGIEED